MIVQCSQCDTKFNLDDAKIPEAGAWVRCSKCEEVFQVMPPTAAKPPVEDEEEIIDLDKVAAKAKGKAAKAGDFGLEIEGEEEEASGRAAGRGKGFKILFWILAVLILLPVLSVGALVGMDRLGLATGLVDRFRGLPLVGALLTKEGAGKTAGPRPGDAKGLAPTQVSGYYRVNQQAGRIFVIQGLVENKLQQVRPGVLVRGKLHDELGNPVRQAVVYAGPVFNPDELRQLSLSELQARLGSSMAPDGTRYAAPPGGSVPFMIVFGNLPDNLSHFTAEVVGTEPVAAPGQTAQ